MIDLYTLSLVFLDTIFIFYLRNPSSLFALSTNVAIVFVRTDAVFQNSPHRWSSQCERYNKLSIPNTTPFLFAHWLK